MEASAIAVLDLSSEWMLGVRDGDNTCMELLFKKHRGPLINYLNGMVQNKAIAEELTQEVFLRVYRSRQRYVVSAKFTSWLYQIATRLALNSLRTQNRERQNESIDAPTLSGSSRQLADNNPGADSRIIREAALERVRQAILELPDRQRAAVLMHKYEELSYEQIAEALQCTPQAAKSLLFRAYSTLRRLLAVDGLN